jgi:hypothetical protein
VSTEWLPGATVHDLHPGIGNGPFGAFYGVVLHVNVDEHGTPDSFWGNGNRGQVCPNFQVYKDGSIHQMLPLDWQPWCQVDGNFHYAAIETAGLPNEPLTDAQLTACARIVRAYHEQMGMPLRVANTPGEHGLGIHSMGGLAWGGHSCPGTIRAGQRKTILARAATSTAPKGDDVSAQDVIDALKSPEGQRLVQQAVWQARLTDSGSKTTAPASSWLVYGNRFALAASKAQHVAVDAAAIAADVTGRVKSQLAHLFGG